MITKENDKKATPGKSSPHGTSGATVSSTKPPLPSISGRFVGALMPSLWWLSPAYWIFWYCPKAEAEHKEIFSKSTDSCCSLPPPLRKRSTTSGWCKNKSQDHSVEINQIWSMMLYIYRCEASIYFKMIHFQVWCWTETWDLEGVRHKVSTFSALFRFIFFSWLQSFISLVLHFPSTFCSRQGYQIFSQYYFCTGLAQVQHSNHPRVLWINRGNVRHHQH